MNMKKVIAVVLAAASLLSLAGCGNNETSGLTSTPNSKTDSTSSAVESKPESISTKPQSSSSKPTSSPTTPPPTPQPSGTVTILGKEYDVATTTSLDLSENGITDKQLNEIAPEIAKLINLTELYLRSNQISDITPLAKLTNLMELHLYRIQISGEDIEGLKKQLPNCYIMYNPYDL